jgi:hypothetical protein
VNDQLARVLRAGAEALRGHRNGHRLPGLPVRPEDEQGDDTAPTGAPASPHKPDTESDR